MLFGFLCTWSMDYNDDWIIMIVQCFFVNNMLTKKDFAMKNIT